MAYGIEATKEAGLFDVVMFQRTQNCMHRLQYNMEQMYHSLDTWNYPQIVHQPGMQ